MATNFLLIAPNIIVLERLRVDFDGLKIFREDPLIPENGFQGKDWEEDFHLDLHIQDQVQLNSKTGNVFLTNIQRVYEKNEQVPTASDDIIIGDKAKNFDITTIRIFYNIHNRITIIRLKNNPEICVRLGENLHASVLDKFSIETYTSHLYDIYRKITYVV